MSSDGPRLRQGQRQTRGAVVKRPQAQRGGRFRPARSPRRRLARPRANVATGVAEDARRAAGAPAQTLRQHGGIVDTAGDRSPIDAPSSVPVHLPTEASIAPRLEMETDAVLDPARAEANTARRNIGGGPR